MIIASRSQPPLPIPRLRARRQLVEIGDEELTQAVVQFAACVKIP